MVSLACHAVYDVKREPLTAHHPPFKTSLYTAQTWYSTYTAQTWYSKAISTFPANFRIPRIVSIKQTRSRICRTMTQITQNHLTVQLLSAYVIQITHKLVESRKGHPTPSRKPANQITPFATKDMAA